MKLGLASTIQIINFSTSGTILYSNENNVAMVVYCHVYMQTNMASRPAVVAELVRASVYQLKGQGFESGSCRFANYYLLIFRVAGKSDKSNE